MDVSKQNFTTKKTNLTSMDEDGISMYLSFESTMNSDSEITYKTIAGDSESSSLTDLVDSRGNSTLEAHKVELSGIMKDCITESTSKEISAIRLKPSYAIKGLSALSSTPSQIESPARTKRCSLGQGHKDIERRQKDLSAVFNNLVAEFEQETKENVEPSLSEDSMPSFSKSSIILLQKIKNEVSVAPKQVLSPQQTISKKSLTVINEEKKENEGVSSAKKQFRHYQGEIIKSSALEQQKQNKTLVASPKKASDCILAGVKKALDVINENTEPTISKTVAHTKVKMNSAVRKTMCEPNLQTNRPSRIKAAGKKGRASLANVLNQASTLRDLKSGSASMSEGPDLNFHKTERLVRSNENDKQKVAAVSRKSLSANKVTNGGRKSIAANLQNEKRSTPKRIPAVVKTTFNSLTRKVSRPSLTASNAAVPKRRSVLLLQSKISQSPLTKRKKFASLESPSNDRMNVRIAGGGDLISNSPRKRTVTATRKTMYIEKPDAVKFACTECGASYHVKALLDSHKKTHRATSPDASKKVQRITGGTTGNSGYALGTNPNNQCKFCDKVFMLQRALHIHLLEHCTKIPASERRKLDFTEMDHVRKEETPHFRASQARPFKKVTPAVNAKDPLANFPIANSNEMTKFGSNMRTAAAGLDRKNDDETKKIVRNTSPSRHAANKQTLMAPPGSTKVKKNTAHTGVYRTPNKDIPCVSCKQSFKNVLEFTNHMLAHATLDDCLNSLSGHVE